MELVILFVCTGNICRSPTAELLLRARAGDVPVRAFSAGTSGLTGRPMDSACALAARELGVDTSAHVGRRLDGQAVSAADLVLTADVRNRSSVVQLQPLAFRRVFTMREFARLGAGLPPVAEPVTAEALRARVNEVAGRRGQLPVAEPGADDVPDPFGAGLPAARAAAAQLSDVVDGVLEALGLVRSGSRPS